MARGGVAVSVSDHGPGVSAAEQQRIFRAFHKSARDAAESRPGVGLGLALSRRLARGLGGDLVYQPGTGGGCFVLTLPRER
jgi:signal transduction histidine kinase